MRWKLAIWLAVLVALSIGVGKVASLWYHLNWIASAMWYLAALFLVFALSVYSDASQKYFHGPSSTFKPRFSASARSRFLVRSVAMAIAFAIVGLLDQTYF
jgi:hypothetical protein